MDDLDNVRVSSTAEAEKPSATRATPTKNQCPIVSQRVDHVTSVGDVEMDSLVERLRSQVARLEYENAKLQVDLQNR